MSVERSKYIRSDAHNETELPTIHIISDSLGETAHALARAAAGQFGNPEPYVEVFQKVQTFEEVVTFLEEHQRHHLESGKDGRLIVFFTLVNGDLRRQVNDYCRSNGLIGVDIMGAPLRALQMASGMAPADDAGALRHVDSRYFERIAGMEFTVDHDDGRNTQDLAKADIVLLGVSRSSKTPISIYLGMQGYKVANVPLAIGVEPPRELFDCEPGRVYGLMNSPDVIADIRKRRLSNSGRMASAVASEYADPEYVYRDLEEARRLMRKLGCIVINTKNRAVEETAQEILRYYTVAHPSWESGPAR